MDPRLLSVALTTLLVAGLLPAAEDDHVWVEGEDAERNDAKAHPWYSGQVKTGMLSGGEFLSHFHAKQKHAEAVYHPRLPRAALQHVQHHTGIDGPDTIVRHPSPSRNSSIQEAVVRGLQG